MIYSQNSSNGIFYDGMKGNYTVPWIDSIYPIIINYISYDPEEEQAEAMAMLRKDFFNFFSKSVNP